jgi:cytochrome c biogenesis protein CcmG/thiol:disulfide interchange protein DsbE
MGAVERIIGSPKRVAQLLAVLVVLALGAVLVKNIVSTGTSSTRALGTGDPVAAPALSLPRLDGKGTLALVAFRGRPVVVNFWASWCVPCRDEAPVLERAWTSQKAHGLVVLGVDASDDFAGDARKFGRTLGLTYPLVRDARGSTLGHWGVGNLPTTYFVDRHGRVVGRVLGSIEASDNAGAFDKGVRRILESS